MINRAASVYESILVIIPRRNPSNIITNKIESIFSSALPSNACLRTPFHRLANFRVKSCLGERRAICRHQLPVEPSAPI